MKIGVALGGGGMKGLAHVGVLRVLESARVPIHVVTGTSVGAIVGALYAAGKSPDDIEQLARRTNFMSWFALDRTGTGLFSTDGLRHVLEVELGKDIQIESLSRVFSCVAVDLVTQRETVFRSGSLLDAVCASSAYPGVFAPVQIGERLFTDGGVLNPVPFDVARRMGADCVIAVDLGASEPFSLAQAPRSGLFWRAFFTLPDSKFVRVADRALGIMAQKLLDRKLELDPPDVLLAPQLQTMGILDYDRIDFAMAAGELVARSAMRQIQQTRITPSWSLRFYQGWRRMIQRARVLFAAQAN